METWSAFSFSYHPNLLLPATKSKCRSRLQRERMLPAQCRNPDVVGRNRLAFSLQLEGDLGVVVRARLIDIPYQAAIERAGQPVFVIVRIYLRVFPWLMKFDRPIRSSATRHVSAVRRSSLGKFGTLPSSC